MCDRHEVFTSAKSDLADAQGVCLREGGAMMLSAFARTSSFGAPK
jgi:hypothetical protein